MFLLNLKIELIIITYRKRHKINQIINREREKRYWPRNKRVWELDFVSCSMEEIQTKVCHALIWDEVDESEPTKFVFGFYFIWKLNIRSSSAIKSASKFLNLKDGRSIGFGIGIPIPISHEISQFYCTATLARATTLRSPRGPCVISQLLYIPTSSHTISNLAGEYCLSLKFWHLRLYFQVCLDALINLYLRIASSLCLSGKKQSVLFKLHFFVFVCRDQCFRKASTCIWHRFELCRRILFDLSSTFGCITWIFITNNFFFLFLF